MSDQNETNINGMAALMEHLSAMFDEKINRLKADMEGAKQPPIRETKKHYSRVDGADAYIPRVRDLIFKYKKIVHERAAVLAAYEEDLVKISTDMHGIMNDFRAKKIKISSIAQAVGYPAHVFNDVERRMAGKNKNTKKNRANADAQKKRFVPSPSERHPNRDF
jgi:hypothetical protein